MRRGNTYNILLVYIVDNYLSYTSIKEGFFNSEDFFQWIKNELLSQCNSFSKPRNIIVLNNLNIHIARRVRKIVEARECLL